MEIAWMVKAEEAHLMTVIFQQAHFLTWTLFHYQMELYELPLQRAYFSGVAIDDRVRKSPYEETITPTNPNGDREPFGEEYTIRDLVEKGWIDELINRGK
ncbi:MAG: hypothetical protein R3321_07260 [Nitrososphaeraceae archaeon]|nr:hypothetical protein [Nitrososphaeraceae archaeon]